MGPTRARTYLRGKRDQHDGHGLDTGTRHHARKATRRGDHTLSEGIKVRMLLFVTGLAPMVAIFAVRLWVTCMPAAIVLGVLALLLAALLMIALSLRRVTAPQPFRLLSVRDDSQQVPTYLLTYIFPFLFVAVDGWQDLTAYAIFSLLLVVLILRTDLALVNPLLLAAGYHLYVATTTNDQEVVVVSRTRLLPGNAILAHRLADATYRLDRIQTEEE